MTADIWPNSKKEYILNNVIGVGSTSLIRSAYCKETNKECVIKITKKIEKKFLESLDRNKLKEMQTMANFSHDNIVPYYTSFFADNELWHVLGLFNGGTVFDVIQHKMKVRFCKYGVLDEVTIATLLIEVLKALEFLHANKILHGNIKASNIFIADDGTVQITGFATQAWLSLMKDPYEVLPTKKPLVGSPCWMAPEVINRSYGYKCKADIFSLGITAIEMATGRPPYYKYSPMKVAMLTIQNDPPTLETCAKEGHVYKMYGKTFRKFLNACLQKDPSKRPSATELLCHPFFKKAKDKNYLHQNVVAIGPSLEARVKMLNKIIPDPSSRLHRSNTSEWVWKEEQIEILKPCSCIEDPKMSQETFSQPDANIKFESSCRDSSKFLPHLFLHIVLRIRDFYFENEGLSIHNFIPLFTPSEEELAKTLRNARRELNDIQFYYMVGKDTAYSVTSELVAAGLLDPQELVPVSINLQKLLEQGTKSRTFNINHIGQNEEFNEKLLTGFATLSIVD